MALSRRSFLRTAGFSALAWPIVGDAQTPSPGVFAHGVASGDPLRDAVVLWTRVSPRNGATGQAVDVRWQVTTDGPRSTVVRSGTVTTSGRRDYTVKVDVRGLQPGRSYLYAFEAEGQTSVIGRTKTLPTAPSRAKLAAVSCANFEGGFFNVYAALAARTDLDAILHLGDYIYEFEAGHHGDLRLGRRLDPLHEAITLQDYRRRYANYRLDPDLQEVHRQHPFIAVWDDGEFADDAWPGGALDHDASRGKGNWGLRRAAAATAYREWLPVRDVPGALFRLHRSFELGQLATISMLDTRSSRSAQVAPTDTAGLMRTDRRMLGIAQEQWLYDTVRSGTRAGAVWSIIGQQVMFSPLTPPGRFVRIADSWDGYQAERRRLLDFFATTKNCVLLSGDMHSSWAFEVPTNPWSGYRPDTGAGSVAVEFVTPAVSSAGFFSETQTRTLVPNLVASLPHLEYLEGMTRGYLLLDLTMERLQASYHYTSDVTRRSRTEYAGPTFVVTTGTSHLVRA